MSSPSRNKEKLLNALKGYVTSKTSYKNLLNDPVGSFFQQGPITGDQFNKIYGTPDEFLARHADWEEKYYSRLDTHLNERSNKLIAGFNRRRGIVDLSVLTNEAQKELHASYLQDVLRLPAVIREAGLPGIEMPSGQQYRTPFLFRVDNSSGVQHPAQILLNRYALNFNEDKADLASLTINRQNLFTTRNLKNHYQRMSSARAQASGQPFYNIFGDLDSLGRDARIVTIDTETTGVAEKSQVRSLSGVNMTYRNGQFVVEDRPFMNVGFRSPEFNGITMTSSGKTMSLNEFVAMAEGTDFKEFGPGGKQFLDTASDFIDNITQADRIVGHNIGFDLDKLTTTMLRAPAFASHGRAADALNTLYNKFDSDPNFLIDTLEYSRMYMRDRAEEVVQGAGGIENVSNRYVRAIMSDSALAQGGRSGFADVGTLATNTNFFELLEKEPQAQELFDMLGKGSHVAEIDTYIQSYQAKYMQTGQLKLLAQIDRADQTEFGRFARRIIEKSHATTATTDISDIRHMSNTVFSYVTNRGIDDVSLRGLAGDFQLPGIDADKEGILQFVKSKNAFVFSTADEIYDIESQSSDFVRNQVRKVVQDARAIDAAGGRPGSLRVGSVIKQMTTNAANDKVISYGLNIGQASNIDQLAAMGSIGFNQAPLADDLLNALGTTYRDLGTGLSSRDQIRSIFGRRPVDTVFQQGLSDFDQAGAKRIAETFAKAGDPYAGLMSMENRVFSASVANATASLGREVLRNIDDPADVAFASNAQLMSEYGFSFFRKQKNLRIWDVADEVGQASSRPLIPLELIREAMGSDMPERLETKFSRTVINATQTEAQKILYNAVWQAGDQLDEAQATKLAEGLLDLAADPLRAAKAMGMTEEELLNDKKLISQFHAANIKVDEIGRQTSVSELAARIRQRGIGYAFNEGREAQGIENVFQALGYTMTDQQLPGTATLAFEGSDAVVMSPVTDRAGVIAAGKEADLIAAETIAAGEKTSSALKQVNKISKVLDDTSGLKSRVRLNIAGGKVGMGGNQMLDFYREFKPKIGVGLGIGLLAGAGYYMHKRNQRNDLYDETMERQPTERNMNPQAIASFNRSQQTFAGDPLSTAGIVGNLDRAKIGHTQMGNNKYAHLYGG